MDDLGPARGLFAFPRDAKRAFDVARAALVEMFGGFGTEVRPIKIVREGDMWVCDVRVRELLSQSGPKRFRVHIDQQGVGDIVDLEADEGKCFLLPQRLSDVD